MGNQQKLTEDEKQRLENETKLKELESLKQQIYDAMNFSSKDKFNAVKDDLDAAAESLQNCIITVEQWLD